MEKEKKIFWSVRVFTPGQTGETTYWFTDREEAVEFFKAKNYRSVPRKHVLTKGSKMYNMVYDSIVFRMIDNFVFGGVNK